MTTESDQSFEQHVERRFGVMDDQGFGWGRYETRRAAEERRDELRGSGVTAHVMVVTL